MGEVLPAQPLLSVVVTCFNQESSIGRALDSVTSHNDLDLEVIVVDDCSTDGSMEELMRRTQNQVATSTTSFQVIQHHENRGTWAASATGFLAARGRFVVLLDGDDTLNVEALRDLGLVLPAHDRRRHAFQFQMMRLTESPSVAQTPWVGISIVDHLLVANEPVGAHGGLVISKAEDVDWQQFWLDVPRNLQHDWLLHHRLTGFGYRITPINILLYNHDLRRLDGISAFSPALHREYYRGLNRGIMINHSLRRGGRSLTKAGLARDMKRVEKPDRDALLEGLRATNNDFTKPTMLQSVYFNLINAGVKLVRTMVRTKIVTQLLAAGKPR